MGSLAKERSAGPTDTRSVFRRRWLVARAVGWTLLLLLDCGMPTHLASLRRAADLQISHLLPPGRPVERKVLMNRLDLCHVGFWLRFGSAFLPGDERLKPMAEVIFALQMADGGWNCRIRNDPNTVHSSFHTTFNVLEGPIKQAPSSMKT